MVSFFFCLHSTCTHHFLATIVNNNKNRMLYIYKYIYLDLSDIIIYDTWSARFELSRLLDGLGLFISLGLGPRIGVAASLAFYLSPPSRPCTDRQKGRIAENSWQFNVGVISVSVSVAVGVAVDVALRLDWTNLAWCLSVGTAFCCRLVWSQQRVICCSALRRICSCAHSFIYSFIRSFVDPFTHTHTLTHSGPAMPSGYLCIFRVLEKPTSG